MTGSRNASSIRCQLQVFEMVTELEKSILFAKPEARRVTKRKVDNKDVTDFEISMPFLQLG